MRAPSKTQLVEMVLKAWNSISTEILVKSFKVCGQHKDALPDEIACLKENMPVAEAKAVVAEIWDKTAAEIGEVQNIEEEDDEQLFDNELVVVNGSVAEFVSIWHETDCD